MTPQVKKETTVRVVLGSLVLLTGLWITGMAFGLIDFDASKLNVPVWVFAVCGLLFVTAGIMSFIGTKNRYNELLASFLLLGMGITGGWVSLLGDTEYIAGGIPFLSGQTNILLARILFGLGTCICLSLSGYAFHRFRTFGKS